MNSIVLKRYDNEIFHLDLLEVQIVENAYYWIAKKSIKEVEQLNDQLFNAYNTIGQRIMICYVDLGSKRESADKNPENIPQYDNEKTRLQSQKDSIKLVNDVLPAVAKALFKGMLVTYADVHEYGDTRK